MNCKLNDLKILLFSLLLISISTQAQTRLNNLDMGKIKQKTVRNFIQQQLDSGMVYFEDFHPSINKQTDSSKYSFNQHRFHLKQSEPIAWKTYITAHPADIWEGRIVSCAFIYSPVCQRIIFPTDKYPGLEVGQIFFIELRVFFGMVHFPICFEITTVDVSRNTIAFSYVATGAAQGAQTIHLMEDGKGGVRIIHSSLHNARNLVRDKIFYPIYHKKAIEEVHRNIRKMLVSDKL